MITGLLVAILFLLLLSKTGKSLIRKRILEYLSPVQGVLYNRLIGAAVIVILVAGTGEVIKSLSPLTLASLFATSGILTVASLLIFKAQEITDVSIVSPLMGLVPLATVVPARVINGTVLTPVGVLGVILVSVGAFTTTSDGEFTARSLSETARDPGIQLTILVVLLVGIASPIDRFGALHTPAVQWALLVNTMSAALTLLYILWSDSPDASLPDPRTHPLVMPLLLGASNAAVWTLSAIAYESLSAIVVQSVKRTAIIPIIIFGGKVFEESHIRIKIIGGSAIVVGNILLLLG